MCHGAEDAAAAARSVCLIAAEADDGLTVAVDGFGDLSAKANQLVEDFTLDAGNVVVVGRRVVVCHTHHH